MDAGIITAISGAAVALLGLIGGVIKFIWGKVEARFEHIEAVLEECRRDRELSDKRRSILITIIAVLKNEFRHHLPESTALTETDKLMEEYQALKLD